MGYDTEIVRGYGYRINTCDLEYNGDPEGRLDRWWKLEEDHVGDVDGLTLLMAGDSRAPMPNQAFMLVLTDSIRAGEDYQPSTEQLKKLDQCIAERGLHVDEGPAFFQDTFVI